MRVDELLEGVEEKLASDSGDSDDVLRRLLHVSHFRQDFIDDRLDQTVD